MGKLMLNSVCYTGGSSGNSSSGGGAYIDTNTVIQAQTAIPANTDVTYTATQDCVVGYYINIVANSMGLVSVDGVNVDGGWATALTGLYGCVFLATGQTITLRQTYTTENGVYTVYGVLGGSGGSSSGHNYSTTEQVVGTWIDGKTLYEKTIAVTQNPSSEISISLSDLNIDTLFVESAYIQSNGKGDVTPTTYFVKGDDKFMYYYNRTTDCLVILTSWQGSGYVTIRYTKSSS